LQSFSHFAELFAFCGGYSHLPIFRRAKNPRFTLFKTAPVVYNGIVKKKRAFALTAREKPFD
jgi:hypothetical protein